MLSQMDVTKPQLQILMSGDILIHVYSQIVNINVEKTNNSHENQEISILMIKEARTKLKQRCRRPTVPQSFP
jgi:hypothetical protein